MRKIFYLMVTGLYIHELYKNAKNRIVISFLSQTLCETAVLCDASSFSHRCTEAIASPSVTFPFLSTPVITEMAINTACELLSLELLLNLQLLEIVYGLPHIVVFYLSICRKARGDLV